MAALSHGKRYEKYLEGARVGTSTAGRRVCTGYHAVIFLHEARGVREYRSRAADLASPTAADAGPGLPDPMPDTLKRKRAGRELRGRLAALPDELMLEVMSHLDGRTLARLEGTSRGFRNELRAEDVAAKSVARLCSSSSSAPARWRCAHGPRPHLFHDPTIEEASVRHCRSHPSALVAA